MDKIPLEESFSFILIDTGNTKIFFKINHLKVQYLLIVVVLSVILPLFSNCYNCQSDYFPVRR